MIQASEHPSGCLPLPGHPIEERHIEAALRQTAYLVTQHGDALMPLFERLERDLAEMRRRRDPMDRVRALLDAYSVGDSRPSGSVGA